MAEQRFLPGSPMVALEQIASPSPSGVVLRKPPRPPNSHFNFKNVAWAVLKITYPLMCKSKSISEGTLADLKWLTQPSNKPIYRALYDSLVDGLERRDEHGDTLRKAVASGRHSDFTTWASFAWAQADQEPYKERARAVKEEHAIKNPGYKYDPLAKSRKRTHAEASADADDSTVEPPAKRAKGTRGTAVATGTATLPPLPSPASLFGRAPPPFQSLVPSRSADTEAIAEPPAKRATRTRRTAAATDTATRGRGQIEHHPLPIASTSTLPARLLAPHPSPAPALVQRRAPPPSLVHSRSHSYTPSPALSHLATPSSPAHIPLPSIAHYEDARAYHPAPVPMSMGQYPEYQAAHYQPHDGYVWQDESSLQYYPPPNHPPHDSHHTEQVPNKGKAPALRLPSPSFPDSPVVEPFGLPGPSNYAQPRPNSSSTSHLQLYSPPDHPPPSTSAHNYPPAHLSHLDEHSWVNAEAPASWSPAPSFTDMSIPELYELPRTFSYAQPSSSSTPTHEVQPLPADDRLAQTSAGYPVSHTRSASVNDTSVQRSVPAVQYTLPWGEPAFMNVDKFIYDFDLESWDPRVFIAGIFDGDALA